MIDFSKYTLHELQAIGEVMDNLTSKEVELESWQFACYFRSTAREAFRAESAAIDEQVHEAEKKLEALQAEPAGAPPAREAVEKKIAQHVREAEKKLAALQARDAAEVPAAKVQLSSIYGTCAAEPAGDPPAPPDMFGWVNDALDGLQV